MRKRREGEERGRGKYEGRRGRRIDGWGGGKKGRGGGEVKGSIGWRMWLNESRGMGL